MKLITLSKEVCEMEKYIYQEIKNCEWKYDNTTKKTIDKEISEIYKKNIFYRDGYLKQHKNECFSKKSDSNRNEEWICKLSYKFHPYLNSELGKIIDYQVPLKLPKKCIPLKMQKSLLQDASPGVIMAQNSIQTV